MTIVKKSIPKLGSGAPAPKDPNVIFIDVDDILSFPSRDSGGVQSSTNLTLKEGAKAFGIYLTPSTIDRSDKSEGDPDAERFKHNVSGEHPGDDLPFSEFIQYAIGKNWVIITKGCGTVADTRLHGLTCDPMKISFEATDNKDALKGKLTCAQVVGSQYKSMHYIGTIPELYSPATRGEDAGILLQSDASSITQVVDENETITPIVYSFDGDSASIAWTGTALGTTPPDGLSAVIAAGVVTLSGTPTTAGNYGYTVTVVKANGLDATASGTITVQAGA